MQNSAVFVGGALLGGVLVAACGFDLYPVEEEAQLAFDYVKARNVRLERDLEVSREDGRRLLESQTMVWDEGFRARQDLALSRKNFEAACEDLALAQSDNDVLNASVSDLQEEMVLLGEELLLTREDLSRFRGELGLARESNELIREDLFRMVLRFFAVPRSPADRDLAAAFLSSECDTGDIIALVLELRRSNPELLLSLGLARPGACPLQSLEGLGDNEIDGAGIVPTAGRFKEAAN